jgi:hypothetical protein
MCWHALTVAQRGECPPDTGWAGITNLQAGKREEISIGVEACYFDAEIAGDQV